MSASSPRKLHKRSAPSRAGSELSCSTIYSSSSTLVLEEWFHTPPDSSPSKPWAIKALNQLGLKCKKSMVFGKDKKKAEDDLDKEEEEPYVSPYTRTPPPFILDISKEAVARRKEKELEADVDEDLELLPEAPQMLRRAPSSNALMHFQSDKQRPSLSTLRSGSTPDLRSTSKRNASPDDPFYLESLLKEFPRPPVRNPGEYTRREPVHPRVRRQNSNFSYPSSRAYPELVKSRAKHWIDRPVGRDVFFAEEQPHFSERSDRGSD